MFWQLYIYIYIVFCRNNNLVYYQTEVTNSPSFSVLFQNLAYFQSDSPTLILSPFLNFALFLLTFACFFFYSLQSFSVNPAVFRGIWLLLLAPLLLISPILGFWLFNLGLFLLQNPEFCIPLWLGFRVTSSRTYLETERDFLAFLRHFL